MDKSWSKLTKKRLLEEMEFIGAINRILADRNLELINIYLKLFKELEAFPELNEIVEKYRKNVLGG